MTPTPPTMPRRPRPDPWWVRPAAVVALLVILPLGFWANVTFIRWVVECR